MPLAADYPLLEVLWTISIIALWVMWIFIVVWTLVDNFRRSDHSGGAKAGWTLFIIFVPVLGALVYLIARPQSLDVEARPVQRPEDRAYTVGAAQAQTAAQLQTATADELKKLADLKDQGVLTAEEFEAQKQRLLGS